MSQPEMSLWPSAEAVAFIGVAIQAAAIVWIWHDWNMSQYKYEDWRKRHRQSESETLDNLAALWAKFGGSGSVAPIDWDSASSAELQDVAKGFPVGSDDDALKGRKVAYLTQHYGVGPSDADFVRIRDQLDHLALLRRGVADYRTFVRKKTFQTALRMMLVGFTLQLLGTWPSRWLVAVERPPAATDQMK